MSVMPCAEASSSATSQRSTAQHSMLAATQRDMFTLTIVTGVQAVFCYVPPECLSNSNEKMMIIITRKSQAFQLILLARYLLGVPKP